jgi:hypothetical protein
MSCEPIHPRAFGDEPARGDRPMPYWVLIPITLAPWAIIFAVVAFLR